jgi:hypothetical protein
LTCRSSGQEDSLIGQRILEQAGDGLPEREKKYFQAPTDTISGYPALAASVGCLGIYSLREKVSFSYCGRMSQLPPFPTLAPHSWVRWEFPIPFISKA